LGAIFKYKGEKRFRARRNAMGRNKTDNGPKSLAEATSLKEVSKMPAHEIEKLQ